MDTLRDYYSDDWLESINIGGEATPPEGDMSWWYREPAKTFWEALPIGNGRFFGMVYGGAPDESIPFNDETLWTGKPNDPLRPNAHEAMTQVRELVMAGRYRDAMNASWDMFSNPRKTQLYQPMGELRMQFDGHHRVFDYRRELDMDRAMARTEYKIADVTVKRDVFASYPDGVIVVRLTADHPSQFSFKVWFDSIQPSAAYRVIGDHELAVSGRTVEVDMESRMTWEARARILPEGGQIGPMAHSVDKNGKPITALRVQNADAVTIVLAGATNYIDWQTLGADPAARCEAYLAAADRPYDELLRRHLDDYQPLFRACRLDLGKTRAAYEDTTTRLLRLRERKVSSRTEALHMTQLCPDPHFIAQYFQYGRYLLLAGSRRDTYAFNNHNPWLNNLEGRWRGRWTLNINVQECYWCAENCHLPETADALLLFIQKLAESGARTARELYGCRGWVAHHSTDIWMNTAPTDRARHGMFPTAGAWLCQSLWEHYLFDPNEAYLGEIYPLIKGAAEFLADLLIEDPESGYLVTGLSGSPENEFRTPDGQTSTIDKCTAMDAQIMRDLFGECITAATLLGVDEAFCHELRGILPKLPPHKIGRWGKLQEWFYDWEEPREKHRHISHLYAMYPACQITLRGTPELSLAVRKSLEQRGDALLGWSGAWKINLYARFEEGERAYDILDRMLTAPSIHPFPDDSDRVPSMEGNQAIQGVTAGIAEMLLQSHGGEINLLPALPRVWSTGSVKGLRARGGYEVDIAWENGYLTKATIHAKYNGTCRLRFWSPVVIEADGAPVPVSHPEPTVSEFTVCADTAYIIQVKKESIEVRI